MKPIITNKSSEKDSSYKPKKDRSFKILLFAVASFFIGFGLCIGYYSQTLIDIYNLSKFLIGFAVVGFFIPLKVYRKWLHIIKYEMIIFNIIGVAPLLTGIFLTINYTFSNNPSSHNYRIERLYFEGEENYKSIGVVLEKNFFSGERKIVELTNEEPSEVFNKKHLKVTISEGLFGFKVIKERVLIK